MVQSVRQRPRTVDEVRSALRPELPQEFFARNPARVGHLLLAFGALAGHLLVTALASGSPWFPAVYALSLLFGGNVLAFAFFYFHEAQHGAVFARGSMRFFSSLLAGTPFLLTPAVWRRWHDHHHRHTSMPADFDRQRHPEFDEIDSPTSRLHAYLKHLHWSKATTWLAMIFSIAASHGHAALTGLARRDVLALHKVRVLGEYAAMLALFCTPLLVLPADLALAGYLAPVLLANMVASAYVISNHCDSPVTARNYPLVNARSVHILGRVGWSHMHFGRHVEHHLFPSVTHDRLAVVSRLLRTKFPDEFDEAGLAQTIGRILRREERFPPLVR